ncbi:hypothetical protein KAU33_09115 [Candidatus Dependentiae bacterium]|nr:hypothetical protein [Candidatus Dependentiae bacterium]
MEENIDVNAVVKKIRESRNCGTEDSFIIVVSHILLNSGIKKYSNIHRIFYLSEIPLNQGTLIINKLEYLISCKEPRMKNVTSLIEKLKFKFDIPLEEFDRIESIIKNEFEMNNIPEYLGEHDEIDNDSFMLGFITCISTCVN